MESSEIAVQRIQGSKARPKRWRVKIRGVECTDRGLDRTLNMKCRYNLI